MPDRHVALRAWAFGAKVVLLGAANFEMNYGMARPSDRKSRTRDVADGRPINRATPASVRYVNRSIILNLVRLHQPISRVELSDRTGIFRSSISAIVDELVGEGLLVEKRAKPNGRGRVPVNLFLNPEGHIVLGISIRPFQTRVAVSGLRGEIEDSVSFSTPSNPEAAMKDLARAMKTLHIKLSTDVREVGISVPGMVNADTGEIFALPSLPAYTGFPIGTAVAKLIGAPTSVENDCNLAALAEMWLNNTEVANIHDFVYVQIGDVGVGSGVIIHTKLYSGHDRTWVGEFGHMIVDPNGSECSCGRRGCWEQYVCDRATWNRYNNTVPYGPSRFEELIKAAKNGDAKAVHAFRMTAEWLSLGLSNIVMGLNPKRIVLAGEITRIWGLVQSIIESTCAPAGARLSVYPARFGPEVLALQGSVVLALQRVFALPNLG